MCTVQFKQPPVQHVAACVACSGKRNGFYGHATGSAYVSTVCKVSQGESPTAIPRARDRAAGGYYPAWCWPKINLARLMREAGSAHGSGACHSTKAVHMFSFARLFRRKASVVSDPSAPLTLADVATTMRVLDSAQVQPAALVQDGCLPGGAHSLFRGWQSKPLILRQYELEDVVLDRNLMVFLKDGRPIADTSYLQPPQAVADVTVREDDLVPAPAGQPVMAACFDHWNTNYYHWVVHTVPTLFSLRQSGFDGGLILPQLTPWQEETVRMNGFDPARATMTEPGRQYAFRKVIYTDCVRGAADFSPLPTSRAAYHTMAAQAGVTGREPRTLDLFIERGGASNRLMPNEADLAQALAEAGFTVVRPETLSVADQMRLFAKARLVVGALGAGMANLAWCRPGTVICELVPQQHQNPCNLTLAMQMGLPYWGELIETGVEEESHVAVSQKPFNVPELVHRARQLTMYAQAQAQVP